MNAPAIGAIVAAAAGGTALVIASLVLTVVWRAAGHRLGPVAPRMRACGLAALRLFPAACAVAVTAFVFVAFVSLEPDNMREVLGIALPSMAGASLAIALAAITRTLRAWRETARAIASLSGQAFEVPGFLGSEVPGFRGSGVRNLGTSELRNRGTLELRTIDSAFPIVAVVGLWRPRLFIARSVMAACDRDEVNAMIAHESAHVAARDNLTRLLFLCAPVLGAGSKTAAEIERAWTKASEEAADDLARDNRTTSLALASALTKVARMAAGTSTPLLHASAILSGSAIEHRVRRLLTTEPSRQHMHALSCVLVLVVAVTTVALSPPVLQTLYEAAEFCVRNLP